MRKNAMNNRKKFNYLDYQGAYAMRFRSREEICKFYEYLDKYGLTWGSGDSYLEYKHIPDTSDIETFGLNFVEGRYGSVQFYKDSGYVVLEFSDFDWDGTDEVNITFRYDDLMCITQS